MIFQRTLRCSSVALAAALLALAPHTFADEPSEPAAPPALVAVRYDAQTPCPDRSVFIGNLLARTRRLRLTEDRPDAVVFAVRIGSGEADSHGTLEVTTPGRKPTLREVRAGTCEEVVEALALVAALTIDPDAQTAPLTSGAVQAAASGLETTTEERSEVVAAASPSEVATAGSPSEGPAEGPEESSPPTAFTRPPSVVSRTPQLGRRGYEVGVGGQLELDAAPFGRPFLAWRGFLDVSPRGSGVMRPALGASVALGSDHVEQELGGAELDWVAGRLDLCPVDLAGASWVAVRPCVAFDLGRVSGEGKATKEDVELRVHEARFTWASGALLGRVDFEPLGPLLIRLEGGVLVPFSSEAAFVLRGEAKTETLVNVPSASLVGGVGLGLRFP